MDPTILFTHLKIILLQCFQFSVFSFKFSATISSIQTDPIYLSWFLDSLLVFSLFEIEKESMGKRITLIFLFLITFLVLSSVDVKTKAIQNLSEVDRKLMVLNKPAIKSIKVYFSTNFLLSSYNNKHKQFHTKKKKTSLNTL